LPPPELTKTNFDNIKESSIGVVKWVESAASDGKLSVTDPVRAGKEFLAMIETFALWPQLYDNKPVPDKNEQKKISDSAVDMFRCSYGVAD
jgi:TetR/AcrR family transcriptional regulator, regulator of autoinduction and epiphytic fitness